MDGTIIIPKSGKKFGEDEFDWKFWDKKVPDVLQKHFKEGSSTDIIQSSFGCYLLSSFGCFLLFLFYFFQFCIVHE